MQGHRVFLAEKPDIGKLLAKALGGGRSGNGGIEGEGWVVTWAFGHLLTPYMPQDYNEDLKRWEWEPLPIVPDKFLFKTKDSSSARQVSNIRKFLSGAAELVIATDADREGELIAYEIVNELKWGGKTNRLWLSDLTIPAVQKSISNLLAADKTKPLYWAAAARTYADWLVGMNLSRASTLKFGARGAKPMSVGRVQTPVLAMIVDLERKITNFKPEDYFELKAIVQTANGNILMRHAPAPEERIKDPAKAEALRTRALGAKAPLSVKTEGKTQSPPQLPDLSVLQQECNGRFSWSADKTLKVLQALYEEHHIVTYPRTECRYIPESYSESIPTISSNLSKLGQLKHVLGSGFSPITRKTVYDDKKTGAHHAVIPTNQEANLEALSADEQKLYLLIARFWLAAHMPDMKYLQTTITFDANGVPFRAGGRQITDPGWKRAFTDRSGSETDKNEDDAEAEKEDEDGNASLPPLRDGEPGTASKVDIDKKTTKPPVRFTEKTLIAGMENVARFVDDESAKKTLKATSGIGTPATRSNVIETLKSRDYIQVKKRQLHPTQTAFTLIDAMRSTAPAYADPVMTARWEDVLNMIASGQDQSLVKRFIDQIAATIRKDIAEIKSSTIARMPDAQGKTGAKGKSGGGAGFISGDYKTAIANGQVLKVPFDKKDKAKELGARWNSDKKSWVIPQGTDPTPFKQAGFL